MRWQSFALGFLGLVGLEVIVSSPTAVKGFGGIANGAGNLARKIISPTVPAFGSSSSSSAPTPASPPQAGSGPGSYGSMTPAQQKAIQDYTGGPSPAAASGKTASLIMGAPTGVAPNFFQSPPAGGILV